MRNSKRLWLKFEHFVSRNQHWFWLALCFWFFFIFPHTHTEKIDFDAITATIPGTPPESRAPCE